MTNKKTFVLWVVHADVFAAIGIQKYEAEGERLRSIFSSHQDALLEQHFAALGKNFRLTKDWAELYIEGVIRAMKVAQEAGMTVVYEPYRFLSFKKDLLDIAEKSGVKNVIRMRRLFGDPVKLFLKILKRTGVQNFEVIFAGHFAERCIAHRAIKLSDRGYKPYLLVGTPLRYAEYNSKRKLVEKFFGKDRMITIHQLKNLQ